MGKRTGNLRAQAQKDRSLSRVRAVQELRRSNAAEPIPSGRKYDRNAFRRNSQRGIWEV